MAHAQSYLSLEVQNLFIKLLNWDEFLHDFGIWASIFQEVKYLGSLDIGVIGPSGGPECMFFTRFWCSLLFKYKRRKKKINNMVKIWVYLILKFMPSNPIKICLCRFIQAWFLLVHIYSWQIIVKFKISLIKINSRSKSKHTIWSLLKPKLVAQVVEVILLGDTTSCVKCYCSDWISTILNPQTILAPIPLSAQVSHPPILAQLDYHVSIWMPTHTKVIVSILHCDILHGSNPNSNVYCLSISHNYLLFTLKGIGVWPHIKGVIQNHYIH